MTEFGFRVKYVERGGSDVIVEADTEEQARDRLHDSSYFVDWDTIAFDGRELEIISEFGEVGL